MASITRRGGGWRVRWRDPDGRARSKGVPDRKTAKLVAADIERRVARGLPGEATQQRPVEAEDAVAAFLDHKRAMGSPRSVKTYECPILQFVYFARKGRQKFYLTDMTPELIEDWFIHLSQRASPGHNTRIQYASIIARWWEWSARRFRGGIAPFIRPELPRKTRTKQASPTFAEMDACILAARDGAAFTRLPKDPGWVERMLTIMRFTGLRVRQTNLLTWDDFDLTRATLHVPADTEKTRVGRIIPISPHLVEYLAGLGRREGRLFRRVSTPEAKWVNRAWRAAGVRPQIHGWHAFRRGLETGLLGQLNVDLVRVRALVGHSSGVDDSYIDAAGLNLRDAVDVIPPITESRVISIQNQAETC